MNNSRNWPRACLTSPPRQAEERIDEEKRRLGLDQVQIAADVLLETARRRFKVWRAARIATSDAGCRSMRGTASSI